MSSSPCENELMRCREWFNRHFSPGQPATLPLSFLCEGQSSADLLDGWDADWEETPGPGASVHTLKLTQPATGLQLRCEVTLFHDHPAVEWVCYLANGGSQPTPVIEDILPLCTVLDLPADQACTVRYARGSECKIDDFAPLSAELPAPGQCAFEPALGRSSNGVLPFFNLDMGPSGVVGAIGWTGGWKAQFDRDASGGIRLAAGMQKTHLRLMPGEEIRTPSILLLFWEGELLHGHNMLRQFILKHHTPPELQPPNTVPMCDAVWGENTAGQQIMKAKWWRDNDVPLDIYWIDAGWHGDGVFREDSTVFNSDWHKHVGNWWANKTTYPEGLKQVGDALKDLGLGFALWLEPERVFKDTYFAAERPQWLFGPIGDNWLFNLGNPEARQGLTDLISDIIAEGGITCYRQDFNTDPAPFWEAADEPDRVGMSEIRHIEGLYRFWDDLRARHPGLIIDNCSSGGRRIDLESISRSVPLWRSDYQCYPQFDPIGMQGQTQGLAMWVPLNTGSCDRSETYAFRSALGPGIVYCANIYDREPAPGFPTDWLREMMRQQDLVRKYFYGDFYPLTSYSLQTDTWAAWQFHRADLDEGCVIALRRQDSPYTNLEAKLQGLDAAATYEVEWLSGGETIEMTGERLAAEGLAVTIADAPGSALAVYKRK